MNKNGFFSTIILLFVFFILLFFLYLNLSSNKIVLDDSYRELILAQESSYLQLDTLFKNNNDDCKFNIDNLNSKIKEFNEKNKICKVKNLELKNYIVNLDLNCSVESNIGFKKIYSYNQHLIYKYSCSFLSGNVDQDLE